MRSVGLFAGIGGFEAGFRLVGINTSLMCEISAPAIAVLRSRFPKIELVGDVAGLADLPSGVDVVTAGFPCQDLSQAGRTAGIEGAKSGLVRHVYRLTERVRPPVIVLENVPFGMLHLNGGAAMRAVTAAFRDLGYRWAYRVVDAISWLPQRRERVVFVASRTLDPADVLFADDVKPKPRVGGLDDIAFGFYWTEGRTGLGWAVDSIPPLKVGSSIGIPASPAIILPGGDIVQPSIDDAERLQGFRAEWTKPAEQIAKPSTRWVLVGNAVAVPMAAWLGGRIKSPGRYDITRDVSMPADGKWPKAARSTGKGCAAVMIGPCPEWRDRPPLHRFLHDSGKPLSIRAATGFRKRCVEGKLRRFEPGFLDAVQRHVTRMERV